MTETAPLIVTGTALTCSRAAQQAGHTPYGRSGPATCRGPTKCDVLLMSISNVMPSPGRKPVATSVKVDPTGALGGFTVTTP